MSTNEARLKEALQAIITAYDEWANGPADFGCHRVDLAVDAAKLLLAAQPQETAPATPEAASPGRGTFDAASFLEKWVDDALGKGKRPCGWPAFASVERKEVLKLLDAAYAAGQAAPATAQCDNEISITIRGQEQVAVVMKALHDAGFVAKASQAAPASAPRIDTSHETQARAAEQIAREILSKHAPLRDGRPGDVKLLTTALEAHGLRQRLEEARMWLPSTPKHSRIADLEHQLKELEP